MGPAGNGDYDCGAANRCAHNRQPLVGDDSIAAHQSDACGHEKEADVTHQEVGELIDLTELDGTDLECRREQQHSDNRRWHGRSSEPHYQLAERQKQKQYATLLNHDCKVTTLINN